MMSLDQFGSTYTSIPNITIRIFNKTYNSNIIKVLNQNDQIIILDIKLNVFIMN